MPQNHHQLSDEQLLQAYSTSSNNVYIGILLERYALLLFGVCMKYLKNEDDAKDAVQQVFVKALSELQKYRVVYFKSWLYMVARNHCLMQLRQQHHTIDANAISNQLATADDEQDPLISKIDTAGKEQLMVLLEEGLAFLPAPQQQCVSEFYLNKKSYQQISAATGFNLLQVKSYIQNGKRNLKLWIEKQLKQHAS